MSELVTLLVLLFLSGVFSGSETALVSLSMGRVEALMKEQRVGAAALFRLKADPSGMLTTILIGNNLVNIAASAIATVIATREFGQAGPGIAVGVLTFFILVFGEITPKSLATRYPERISLFVALPLLIFKRVLYPLVWLFSHFTTWIHQLTGGKEDPKVTESELISMLSYGVLEGEIEHVEKEIIERVFEFNDLKVRDVMTPMKDIFSLEGSMTVSEVLPIITSVPHSRLPLRRENSNQFYKVLHIRDLIEALSRGQADVPVGEIAHEPLFVSQYLAIDDLFAKFRHRSRIFAIVVDEFGDERGIVTLEDLLEEIVGEIYDESDIAPKEAEIISDDELIMQGSAELRIIESHFGVDLPGKPTDTVGLWILNHAERIPHANEDFEINDLKVCILEASSRSIERVKVIRMHKLPDTENAAP